MDWLDSTRNCIRIGKPSESYRDQKTGYQTNRSANTSPLSGSGKIPMMPQKYLVRLVIALFFLSACSQKITPIPGEINATASQRPLPTFTPSPSITPLPPTATITPEPVPGITLWQINVRSGPGIYFTLLGQINQNQSIQITGVDASREWYAIIYPEGPEGYGWVTSEYIQASGTDNLPIIGQITMMNGTPAPQASLTQKLNVRSGPGTHYDSLGILPANALIWLIGRNESGSWLQIDYPAVPGGKGWVISGYVQAQDIMDLPVLDSSGSPLLDTPETQATLLISTPTPTIAPAYLDNDTAEKPGVVQTFLPLGISSFSFSSDISSPDGDLEDWIAVRPHSSQPDSEIPFFASLNCSGNGDVQVQLWQDNQSLSNWGDLTCGDINKSLLFRQGKDYHFRLSLNQGSGLRYVLFTFTLRIIP